jgi:hypothetical protein
MVAEAVEWLTAMRSINAVSLSDAEEQREMAAAASASLDRAVAMADAIIGASLAAEIDSSRSFDDRLELMASLVSRATDSRRSAAEREAMWGEIRSMARFALDRGAPMGDRDRKALHWPLAFPEVLIHEPHGFDAIVGNPPFIGGQRITGALGEDYRNYLIAHVARGKRGSADLVAYFFLRATGLTRNPGGIGFFATNSIAQGKTREVGLDQILGHEDWSINRAEKSRQWPGSANVAISQVWMHHGPWKGPRLLDGSAVDGIDSLLDAASSANQRPRRLSESAGISFQGSIVLGMGFVLGNDEGVALQDRDPRNRDVLFPLVNGEDVMSSPSHSPSRWVINFFDWPEERARTYPDCWAIVRERVRPERQRRDEQGNYVLRRPLPELYWIYGEKRPALYRAVERLPRVLVMTAVSKTVLPVFVPTGCVWTHSLFVFAYDDDFHFGLLSSAFHWWWTAKYASTMRADIRYTPTDVFETFPQPEYSVSVELAGRNLDEHRRALMIRRSGGLTKTYNRVCDPDDHSDGIDELRRLHVELDRAVANAYGWSDLALDHGFQATRFGVRYTVGPAMQAEILDRLLELNHHRYAREQAAAVTGATAPKGRRRASRQTPGQMSLVGDGD